MPKLGMKVLENWLEICLDFDCVHFLVVTKYILINGEFETYNIAFEVSIHLRFDLQRYFHL
jgi:hypothetical protein